MTEQNQRRSRKPAVRGPLSFRQPVLNTAATEVPALFNVQLSMEVLHNPIVDVLDETGWDQNRERPILDLENENHQANVDFYKTQCSPLSEDEID